MQQQQVYQQQPPMMQQPMGAQPGMVVQAQPGVVVVDGVAMDNEPVGPKVQP